MGDCLQDKSSQEKVGCNCQVSTELICPYSISQFQDDWHCVKLLTNSYIYMNLILHWLQGG